MVAGVGKLYAQDPPPPGQSITNQAETSYTERDGGDEVILYSNTVEVVVESKADFDFFPNNSVKDFRGKTVEITHFIRNEGNTITTYRVRGYNVAEDDYDLQDLAWNRQVVSRQKAAFVNTDTLETEIELEPGEIFEVSYIGTINIQEERDTLSAVMVFEATDLSTGITKVNTDVIGIRIGAIIDIQKTQIGNENLQRGDSFSYLITGENIGDMTAQPRDILIDNQIFNKVILTDSIPANLYFEEFETFSEGIALYHVFDTDKYEFSSTPPANLRDIDVIALAFDSLQVGDTFSLRFRARVSETASGEIINTAEVEYVDPEGSVVTAAASNDVVAEINAESAEIDYFTDKTFNEKTATSSIGDSLHVQATASACNENRGVVEIVNITLESQITGDMEFYQGVETGRNTGVFRIEQQIPTRDGMEFPVIIDNKILETAEEDVIIATLECAGLRGGDGRPVQINAAVLVDPFGIVFDSETNAVIPGAEIRIYDVTGANNGGDAGGLATVYRPDGSTFADNIQISGGQGKYRFPFLRPGTYRLDVIPPEGYEFTSQVPVDSLPPSRKVDSLASYGMEFTISGDPTGLDFDIPLDALANGVLLAEKNVDRKVADIGDYVNYTITVTSASVNTQNNLRVFDNLPFGFEYEPGTARLDGEELADPIGEKGPGLTFEIGSLAPGAKKKLTYRVYIGPGAERGDGINTARVESDGLILRLSNDAKIKIEVRGGVFSDEALIVGKVFLDCDENNMQDPSELGIPGVRLYLENGNYVITDSEGKYSFYAIKPNKHVLKIDNYSLPQGSRLKVLDNRHAFDPSSRFVDAKKGELHRADFAVCECSPGVFNEIQKRADVLTENTDQLGNSLKQNFTLQENSSLNSSGRFDKASGTVGNVKAPSLTSTPGAKAAIVDSSEVINSTKSEKQLSIEDALANATPGVDILRIADGDTLNSDRLTVWAKGTSGAVFDLYINGVVVPAERIGQRSNSNINNLQIWEYVSLQLKPGKNTLLLQEGDAFGNVRGSKEVTVFVPGQLHTIELDILRNNVPADGLSTALINVRLLDEDGIEIGSRLPVTLDVSRGTWLVQDVNKDEPGTQFFIENGNVQIELKAPIEPTASKIKIAVGSVYSEATIEFLPDLRPLIAAGIIEGTLRFREEINIASAVDNDGFERELKQLSYSMDSFTADARFAFFLKGKVSGRTLLTAGFDSEKEKEERLFRDIRPEEYYPVYGEASIRGYDAQSSGRLYVRVDRGKTYALYGDFITQDNDPDIQLGAYNRSQNGVKTHFEQGALQIDAFGVSSVSARRIREFRANGLSRYELPDNDLIDNSEIIEIITYDRDELIVTDSLGQPTDPSLILSRERLTRFTDYVVDPFTGVITFKAPISSVDMNFNPIYIRATYEVENDENRFLIGGVGANLELVDGLNVGANIVQDNNPANEFTLASGNVNYQLGKDTRVVAEIAHTQSDNSGIGTAGRVEIQHRGRKFDVLTTFGKSSEEFNNRGASLGQSRTEARARTRYSLTNDTKIGAEFLLSRNDTTGDQTLGSLVNLQHSFSQGINAEVGVRYSEKTGSDADEVTNTNLRSKLTAQLPFVQGASTFGEYEQDLNASDRRLIALGGEYKIRNFAKAFARHEFVSSTGGRYTLQSNAQRNSTVIGLNADYMKNGQVFSEYRMSDALEGRSGQASIGLRNRFVIREGLGMNAGFERIFTVQGPNNGDGTSISTAIDYTGNPNWKGTARAEARFGQNTDTYLNSLGYGLKINTDWTILARNIISVNSERNAAGIQKLQERMQFGAAYRNSETNSFDALFRYEFKHERDENIAPDFFRSAHVLSTHANLHPNSDLVITGRVATKYAVEGDDQMRSNSFLELISGRVIYDLNERWDAGINASLMANADFTTKDYGLGVEVGYIVATNLRLATGFNFFGYEDDDLTVNNYTQPGAYLGFAYKFDEQVFRNLAPNRSSNFINEDMYLTCMPCSMPDIKTMPIDMFEHELEPVILTRDMFDYEALETLVLLPRQVHFDNDKSYINASTAQMLDKLAKYLSEKDDYMVDLNGFTDMKASVAYNQALSERRSLAVRAYLVAAGVEKRRLLVDGFGEVNATGKDMVEMSLERRVEFDLNELNEDVEYIDQVEDLQINQKVKNIGGWEYIFKSEHNAVPTNLNLASGSDQLNYLHRYLIERIAIALDKYPEIGVQIALPADDRFISLQQQILNALAESNADINRYRFARGVEGNQNTIRISYDRASLLQLFAQEDDIKFVNNTKIPELLESLLRVLKSRTDYDLLNDLSQSYVVPDRINFVVRGTTLDNESQAVVSRIGSYLRNNAGVFVELRGDGSQRDQNRMQQIRKYLESWGIDGGRVEFSTLTIQTNGQAIRVEYKNADSINLLNIESLNLRPGVGSGAGR